MLGMFEAKADGTKGRVFCRKSFLQDGAADAVDFCSPTMLGFGGHNKVLAFI